MNTVYLLGFAAVLALAAGMARTAIKRRASLNASVLARITIMLDDQVLENVHSVSSCDRGAAETTSAVFADGAMKRYHLAGTQGQNDTLIPLTSPQQGWQFSRAVLNAHDVPATLAVIIAFDPEARR